MSAEKKCVKLEESGVTERRWVGLDTNTQTHEQAFGECVFMPVIPRTPELWKGLNNFSSLFSLSMKKSVCVCWRGFHSGEITHICASCVRGKRQTAALCGKSLSLHLLSIWI